MFWRILSCCALLLCLGLLTGSAQDKKAVPNKINWSDWVDHSVMVGEVTKIEKDGSFTLSQVSKQLQQTNPRARPTIRTTTVKTQLSFAEEGMLRYKELPQKVDEKGKRVPYTAQELRELRLPLQTPGYATDRSSLQIGHIVEATLVRPKKVKLNELVPQDLRIKYAVILTKPEPIQVGLPEEPEKKSDEKKDVKKP